MNNYIQRFQSISKKNQAIYKIQRKGKYCGQEKPWKKILPKDNNLALCSDLLPTKLYPQGK
jgi:hypothetical protein